MTSPAERDKNQQGSDFVIPRVDPERLILRHQRAAQILYDVGAIVTNDHFQLSSGKHSSEYVNKDAVYPHTEQTRELCRMWAEDFADRGIDVVVGPAVGAITLENNTASELTRITGREVFGVYAEKDGDGGFSFTRGYEKFVQGQRVLVVEDVLTTGGSVAKVVDLVRRTGGELIGVGVLVNRGGVKPKDIGVDEIDALVTVSMDSWLPENCSLCEKGVPINTSLGQGKQRKEQ